MRIVADAAVTKEFDLSPVEEPIINSGEERIGALITNEGDNPATLFFDETLNIGHTLEAGRSFNELALGFIYTGKIYARSSLGTTLSVTRFIQK